MGRRRTRLPVAAKIAFAGPEREYGRAHYLSGLAITALRHVNFNPRALQRMGQIARKAFNCGDLLACDTREWRHTRTYGVAVQMDGARSAQGHAAAEFCPCQSQRVTDNPEQRRRRIIIDSYGFSIQEEGSHRPLQEIAVPSNAKDKPKTRSPASKRLCALVGRWMQLLDVS